MTMGNMHFQFNPPCCCCCAAKNSFLATSLGQFFNLCPMSLQYLKDISRSVVPPFPAASWSSCHLSRNFFPVILVLTLLYPACVVCKAVVNACCKAVELRNSLIWEFLATAWSNLVWRSLICEECTLSFASCFLFDLASELFSSGSASTADVVTALADALFPVCWWVPKTWASSLQN